MGEVNEGDSPGEIFQEAIIWVAIHQGGSKGDSPWTIFPIFQQEIIQGNSPGVSLWKAIYPVITTR